MGKIIANISVDRQYEANNGKRIQYKGIIVERSKRNRVELYAPVVVKYSGTGATIIGTDGAKATITYKDFDTSRVKLQTLVDKVNNLGSHAASEALDMKGFPIRNIEDPETAGDAVNLQTFDQGLIAKELPRKNNLSLYDKFRQSYLGYIQHDNVYRSSDGTKADAGNGTKITISTVSTDAVGNYFDTNMVDWGDADLSPSWLHTNDGIKWAFYLNGSVTPDGVVDKFDKSNGRIYYTTVDSAPVVSNTVEFLNPFVNMSNILGYDTDARLLTGFVAEGGAWGSSGYNVDFLNSSGTHWIKSDGTHVLGFNVRTTGTLNSLLAFAETKDFINWTIIEPVFDGHDVGYDVDRFSWGGSTPYKVVIGNTHETYHILWIEKIKGTDTKPHYAIIDEEYNIIQDITALPLDDYDQTNQNFQFFDTTVWDNKIRIMGWDWDGVLSNPADERVTTEYIFDTNDYAKVLDGTATFTKIEVHESTGADAVGLLDSSIDTWKYLEYGGRLYGFHTYVDRANGHVIGQINRGYKLSMLGDSDINGESGDWVHEKRGLFFTNAIHWNEIDSPKWYWQYDHVGGHAAIIPDDVGGWRLIIVMKNASNTYWPVGFNLADFTVNDHYSVNNKAINKLTGLQAKNLAGKELQEGNMFIATTTDDAFIADKLYCRIGGAWVALN